MIDWITISQDSGSGNATITVTADSYLQLVERTASLKVSTVSNRVTRYVNLVQNAAPVFSVSPSVINFDGSGSTVQIDITSTYEWTATTIPAWVTLSSSSGNSGTTITSTAPTNYGGTRGDSIVFTDSRGLTASVSVSQVNAVVPEPTVYQIFYKSSDGQIVTPRNLRLGESWGGANLISNTYSNGLGILTFDAPVKEIPSDIFRSAYLLTYIYIPKSVTNIANTAFYHSGLETFKVVSDGNLRRIGVDAFAHANLSTVEWADHGPNEIDGCAFQSNTGLTSFVIPEECTFVGQYALADCTNLTDLYYYHDYGHNNNYYSGGDVLNNDGYGNLHTPSGIPACFADSGWTLQHDTDYHNDTSYGFWPSDCEDYGWTWWDVFAFGPNSGVGATLSGSGWTMDTKDTFGTKTRYQITADYANATSGQTVSGAIVNNTAECELTRYRVPAITGITTTSWSGVNRMYALQLVGYRTGIVSAVDASPAYSKCKVYSYGSRNNSWRAGIDSVVMEYVPSSRGAGYRDLDISMVMENGQTMTYSYRFNPSPF